MNAKEKLLARKPTVKAPSEVVATSNGWARVLNGVEKEILYSCKNLNKIIGEGDQADESVVEDVKVEEVVNDIKEETTPPKEEVKTEEPVKAKVAKKKTTAKKKATPKK